MFAFDHLFTLGHRRIGFAGRSDDVVAFNERFTAFKLKMAEVACRFGRTGFTRGEPY